MWGQGPWGGYGANPLPMRLQRLWNQTNKKLSGGFPYSEGIYEDLNKVICGQSYWNPDRRASDTIKEYVAFEYSPDVVGDVAAAVEIVEQNHLRDRITPRAGKAYELIQAAEKKLSLQSRGAWRWRILALRALIDNELLKHHGRRVGVSQRQHHSRDHRGGRIGNTAEYRTAVFRREERQLRQFRGQNCRDRGLRPGAEASRSGQAFRRCPELVTMVGERGTGCDRPAPPTVRQAVVRRPKHPHSSHFLHVNG